MRRKIKLAIKQLSTGFTRVKEVNYTQQQITTAKSLLNTPQGDYMIVDIYDNEQQEKKGPGL